MESNIFRLAESVRIQLAPGADRKPHKELGEKRDESACRPLDSAGDLLKYQHPYFAILAGKGGVEKSNLVAQIAVFLKKAASASLSEVRR